MRPPDASTEPSSPDASILDASDAFVGSSEPFPEDAKSDPEDAGEGGKTSRSSASEKPPRRSRRAASGRPRGLLDSSSPLASTVSCQSPSSSRDSPEHAAERLAKWEVLHHLWSLLDVLRGTDIRLHGFSLTSPIEATIHAHATEFARLAESGSVEGALVVRDVGPRHDRRHYYALVLTRDAATLHRRWCETTGADPRRVTAKPAGDGRKLPSDEVDEIIYSRNVTGVVFYAFHPLSDGTARSLDRDVLASGPFAPVWEAARRAVTARLTGKGAAHPEDAGEASLMRRQCPRCHAPFRLRKRPQAKWCSDRCRKAAHAAGQTVLHGQIVPKVRATQPNADAEDHGFLDG